MPVYREEMMLVTPAGHAEVTRAAQVKRQRRLRVSRELFVSTSSEKLGFTQTAPRPADP